MNETEDAHLMLSRYLRVRMRLAAACSSGVVYFLERPIREEKRLFFVWLHDATIAGRLRIKMSSTCFHSVGTLYWLDVYFLC